MQGLRSLTARAGRALAFQQQARARVLILSVRTVSSSTETATPLSSPVAPGTASPTPRIPLRVGEFRLRDPPRDVRVEQQLEKIVFSPEQKTKLLRGRVVSTKMIKTVKVRVAQQTWNKKLQKYYRSHTDFTVHDPASSLRDGDFVSFAPWNKQQPTPVESHSRASPVVHKPSEVRHIVREILVPFGPAIADRPAIPLDSSRGDAMIMSGDRASLETT